MWHSTFELRCFTWDKIMTFICTSFSELQFYDLLLPLGRSRPTMPHLQGA
jgi:hypothetical protein